MTWKQNIKEVISVKYLSLVIGLAIAFWFQTFLERLLERHLWKVCDFSIIFSSIVFLIFFQSFIWVPKLRNEFSVFGGIIEWRGEERCRHFLNVPLCLNYDWKLKKKHILIAQKPKNILKHDIFKKSNKYLTYNFDVGGVNWHIAVTSKHTRVPQIIVISQISHINGALFTSNFLRILPSFNLSSI